jgi:hypothetical protein
VGNCEVRWDVLSLPGVQKAVTQAARKIHKRYENVIELEDLEQEATIIMVTRLPERAQACAEGAGDDNLGTLQHELEMDLVDYLRPKAAERQKTISYDALVEKSDEDGLIAPYVVIETASNDYTRESVETLLPAVWDESYLYGLPQRDDAPDPDMPKGSTNKARGNNLSAYIADIKTGWEKTPLTTKERRALILAYGLGWPIKEIAYNQGVSDRAIRYRIEGAVGKIVARLNSGYWYELEGIEA